MGASVNKDLNMSEWTIGIIGGSGLYAMQALEDRQWIEVSSPWGKPSDKILCGTIGNVRVRFLPRHGRGHPIIPGKVDSRANIDALKRAGCTDILAISAVGSLSEDLPPGRSLHAGLRRRHDQSEKVRRAHPEDSRKDVQPAQDRVDEDLDAHEGSRSVGARRSVRTGGWSPAMGMSSDDARPATFRERRHRGP